MVVDFKESDLVCDQTTFLESFQAWCNGNTTHQDLDVNDQFSLFFKRHAFGKSQFEINCDFAFQLYCIQECVEGLIEDMEEQ